LSIFGNQTKGSDFSSRCATSFPGFGTNSPGPLPSKFLYCLFHFLEQIHFYLFSFEELPGTCVISFFSGYFFFPHASFSPALGLFPQNSLSFCCFFPGTKQPCPPLPSGNPRFRAGERDGRLSFLLRGAPFRTFPNIFQTKKERDVTWRRTCSTETEVCGPLFGGIPKVFLPTSLEQPNPLNLFFLIPLGT